MGERAAGDVGEDLLDDGVVGVLALGLDEPEATIALTRRPLEPGTGSLDKSHSPRSEGTFHVNTPENTTI
jgi:hypothetical protein